MTKNIEPKLKRIGDYLKLEDETVFVIPEYQRAYSWSIDNCDKLWQDINDFAVNQSRDRYFFGTVIINCSDDDTKYGLIDGQQRTTTFLLLLKALLLRINQEINQTVNDEDSASLYRGLQERRRRIMGILYKAETEDISDVPDRIKDAEIFKNPSFPFILENYSINELYKDELKKILNAVDYDTAEASVIKIKYKQKDNRYTNFFRNFKFFYEKTKTGNDFSPSKLNSIAKIFTENCEIIEIKSWQVEQAITMFNSLNSDGLPLYDSDIISAKLYAAAEKEGNEKEFAEQWKHLNEIIRDLSSIRIDINSILMQYMYYVRTVKREIISNKNSVDVTTPGLRRYFTEINKEPISTPLTMCADMIKLAKIWKKVLELHPQLSVLLKFNENSKLFLASYFFRFDENNIKEEFDGTVLECLLRLFALLELVDAGYSSKNFKTFLFGMEVKLADKNIPMSAIKKDFDEHICANWEKNVIEDTLQDYTGNALVFLNEYLFAKENGIKFKLGLRYDIEHIMPNSGSNLQEIRKDADIANEDEFIDVVNRLGNKILLEEKINRAIGNEWFRTKVSTRLINKTGYIDSTYPIAQALVTHYEHLNKPYWKKDDIFRATGKASRRIVNFIFGE